MNITMVVSFLVPMNSPVVSFWPSLQAQIPSCSPCLKSNQKVVRYPHTSRATVAPEGPHCLVGHYSTYRIHSCVRLFDFSPPTPYLAPSGNIKAIE